ncbi:hypothetical protein AMTR_s00075p00098720, partial [Amborella trichopoda]
MHSRGSSGRLSAMVMKSRISFLMFSMLATMASLYVAGRLWQDAEARVYLIKELDRRTGQGQPAISVDDTLKVLACKDQQKKLSALEMELAAARSEGFVSKHSIGPNGTHSRRRLLAVIGIITEFGHKNNRDSIRKSWMPTGAALKKLEDDKGIAVRFIIGRSANRGDSLDRAIDEENSKTNDFLILEDHVEVSEELSKKTKKFFVSAADTWDSDFYAKVNDDVYVNLDSLGAMLTKYWEQPRVYIGCMKSGEVFSERSHKWYEPDWWKFGDKRSYFRHASGEMYIISRALAQFISINRGTLSTYAHDDVTVGSWMIALDVKHVDEGKLCCSTWSP